MSYMQFQQQCMDCKKHWNAAFGMVGTTIIASPPNKCPHCGSENLERIAEEWEITPLPTDMTLEEAAGVITTWTPKPTSEPLWNGFTSAQIDAMSQWEKDYLILQSGVPSMVLNRYAPNLTVCPRCCVDDFTHVEGCAFDVEEEA